MSTKIKEIDNISKEFELEGYILLTKEYINQSQKLEYLCPNGHKRTTTWKNWKKGCRCLICKNHSTKPTIETVRKDFESEGYTLLSDTYITNKVKLDYICPNGHKNSITWADWSSGGYRCPDCANNKKLDIERVIIDFNLENYTFISGTYANNTSILIIKCPKGHEFETSRVKWTTGNRCPICYSNRINIDIISESFEFNGCKLFSKEYVDAHSKLKYICSNGHAHEISWAAWQQGERCYYCSRSGTSTQEQDLINHIKNFNIIIDTRDRSTIKPKELDIIIPSKKAAIEYCGLYWHSIFQGKDDKYHIAKLDSCNNVGYDLITIFEDEWVNKKKIVLSRLKNILGIKEGIKTLYARKLNIKEIDISTARQFCEENHLQGYTGSNIKLGAFYGNELVSIMTFSKPSISKGQNNYDLGVWELNRFCSKLDYKIVGVASKLLSHFKNNYEWIKIFSYADRRWSNGNLYKQIGFEFDSNTKPNYWYFKNGDIKRHHRFVLRKKPNEPKNITEWELRKSQGWNRIWDCGNKKYVTYNK